MDSVSSCYVRLYQVVRFDRIRSEHYTLFQVTSGYESLYRVSSGYFMLSLDRSVYIGLGHIS
jgi:hypothetical protein